MKRLSFLTILIALAGVLHGQPQTTSGGLYNYGGLRSSGPVPTDLKYSLNELYTLDKQRVRDYTDGKLPNRDKVLTTSYHINKLMASGRIVYGDPITQHIERIADTLLKDYPELRAQLRFYTVKSPEVNAFATGQGMIFVNTGLIAQIEDEAQLAYIISHEIIHYYRNHNTEVLAEKKERQNNSLDSGNDDLKQFIKRHNRSKEMENEADSLGLALFYINSPYDKRVTDGVFDVLQYSYLPFDEVVFDTTFFNTPYYHVPQEYFLKELDPITARDDYNDSLSTHPNLLKRRIKTSAQLASHHGGSRFVTMTEEEFEEMRTLARFECLRLELIYSEFARAFYDSYLLLRQHPDNVFLNRAMGQALYGIAKNKTYTSTSNVIGDYNDMEGEVQQAYYLFRQIKADEMTLLAARYLWNTWQRFPDDKQLAFMVQDIFEDLGKKHNMHRAFFLDHYETPTATGDTISTTKSAKYARIKAKRALLASKDMRSYLFTDLLQNDTNFATRLDGLLEGDHPHPKAPLRDNQFLHSPSYYVVNNLSQEVNIRKSYSHEEQLVDMVETVGKQFGMHTIDFSDQSIGKMADASQYNEFVILNEWVSEFWQTRGDFPMKFLMQPQMDSLSTKYNASLINLSIVLNVEHDGSGFNILSPLILLPPLYPVYFYKIAAYSEKTLIYTLLIDAQNGKLLAQDENYHEQADCPSLIKSNMYNTYANMDSTSKDSTTITPGYLGKRLAVSVKMTASPNLIPTMNRESLGHSAHSSWAKLLNIGFSPTVELEYAIKPKTSIGLYYNYRNTGDECAPMYNMHTGGIMARFYNKRTANTYAPLGPYWSLGLFYSALTPLNDDGLFHEIQSPEVWDATQRHQSFGIQIGGGRHYVFFDRVMLDLSVDYSLVANNVNNIIDDIECPTGHILWANILKLGIGVGFLPF